MIGVLDDLGTFHLVDVVLVILVMHSHNLFDGSLLDPVLRYTNLRLCDFRNSDDLLLLSTES